MAGTAVVYIAVALPVVPAAPLLAAVLMLPVAVLLLAPVPALPVAALLLVPVLVLPVAVILLVPVLVLPVLLMDCRTLDKTLHLRRYNRILYKTYYYSPLIDRLGINSKIPVLLYATIQSPGTD